MAIIDDTVGKLARVYDSQTDTWIPLIGSPTPHVHNISSSPDVDITGPLADNEILEYSTSASAFINTASPTFTDLSVTNNISSGSVSSDFMSISDTASINNIVVTGESKFSYQLNSQSASYILSLEDHGRVVPINNSSANTLTVPPNDSVAFPVGSVVNIIQTGSGQTTITPGSGVTLRSEGNKLKTKAQYALVGMVKVATDEWVVFGNLTS
jgi:hypothetical protein